MIVDETSRKKRIELHIEKLKVSLSFSQRALSQASTRASDLEDMLNNHLNPVEPTLPLSEQYFQDYEAISGSYWKRLTRDGKYSLEFGFTIDEIGPILHLPADHVINNIKTKVFPKPASVFNGVVKYNLLQFACLILRNDKWRITGDLTKHWYAHLHHEALVRAKKKQSKVDKLEAEIKALTDSLLELQQPVVIPQTVTPLAAAEPARPAPAPQKKVIGNRKIPSRKKNEVYRDREYLTDEEVEQLIAAAGSVGRHKHRDQTLVLFSYRHALTISELVSIKWSDIDLTNGLLKIEDIRGAGAKPHRLGKSEVAALIEIKGNYRSIDYVFVSERNSVLTDHTVRKIIERAGILANLPLSVHPHMLRHSCGYKMSSSGFNALEIQNYLGLSRIDHVARYFEKPSQLLHVWQD